MTYITFEVLGQGGRSQTLSLREEGAKNTQIVGQPLRPPSDKTSLLKIFLVRSRMLIALSEIIRILAHKCQSVSQVCLSITVVLIPPSGRRDTTSLSPAIHSHHRISSSSKPSTKKELPSIIQPTVQHELNPAPLLKSRIWSYYPAPKSPICGPLGVGGSRTSFIFVVGVAS